MGRTIKRLALAALLLLPALAHAEVDVVKIPKGAGGVGFLPLVVMEELKLVEQEAQKMGIRLGAEYIKFGGPSVVNDMLPTAACGVTVPWNNGLATGRCCSCGGSREPTRLESALVATSTATSHPPLSAADITASLRDRTQG